MIKRLNSTDKRYYIFMILTIAVAAFYAALMCNKTMPFAEGWYTYYAQLINEKGLLPYRDFEYLFSPLYIYFIAFITRFFGYDILTLRCVGILMFVIIALGVYLFITEIVGRKRAWIAAIASVTAVMYLQSEVVQIFYDYIRLMDIFAVFTVLFLYSRCQSNGAQRKSRRKSKSFSLWSFQFPLHKCKTKCRIDFLGIYNSSNYLLRRVFSTVHKSNCKEFNAIFIAYCSSNRCNLFVAGRNWGIERIFVHDGWRRN